MAHFPYSGNILMIGYGSVGRCTMPLIEKHFGMNTLSRVTVVDGHDHRADAQRFIDKGMNYLVQPIVRGEPGSDPRQILQEGRPHPQPVGRGAIRSRSSNGARRTA